MKRIVTWIRGLVTYLAWLLRPRLPWPVARRVLKLRIERAQRSPRQVALAQQQMSFLLGEVATPEQIAEASLAYLAFSLHEAELRWHPGRAMNQRIDGIEHLRDAQAQGRGVIVSFVHHGYYASMFGALKHAGVPNGIVSGRNTKLWTAGPALRQHMRLVAKGGWLVLATEGTQGLSDRLAKGEVLMVAPDVPGNSRVTMAQRKVKASSGAIWAARVADSPIVSISTYRDDDGAYLRISPPLYPSEHPDTQDLLELLIARHEQAILAWPEATFSPTLTWMGADD